MKADNKEVQRFSYPEVERVLAATFGFNEKTLPVLRAKLKTFQRAKITPASPGRGRVIRYTVANIYDWALALSISNLDIGPEKMRKFFKLGFFGRFWAPRIDSGENLFFAFMPTFFENPDVPVPFLIVSGSETADSISEMNGCIAAALVNLAALKRNVDKELASMLRLMPHGAAATF